MQSWVIIGMVAALIVWIRLRKKLKAVSPIGQVAAELKRLSQAYNGSVDSPEDLTAWEQALSVIERHPSIYNKLNGDIHFIQAFTGYLEKNYPEDARLETLRQFAYYRKDSIWGIPIKRD
ncbi:hypothetical protein LJK88_43705 [Paenibacillus sp. P26]|nr:hypothetical protein LJK88_43705 [Paenibacillus sp. P26]UUZ92377.1 hypothetical protein LJK87_44590 [Paenibacillus sp. P25]